MILKYTSEYFSYQFVYNKLVPEISRVSDQLVPKTATDCLVLETRLHYRRPTGSCTQSIKWCHFQQPGVIPNNSSAVAEMGDRLATIDMGQKVGGLLCQFLWGNWLI